MATGSLEMTVKFYEPTEQECPEMILLRKVTGKFRGGLDKTDKDCMAKHACFSEELPPVEISTINQDTNYSNTEFH